MYLLRSFSGIYFFLLIAIRIEAQEIFQAASTGNLVKVKELVEADPQLMRKTDERGRTPLHLAARGVHFEVIRFLVENGADVNARDANGSTPLHSTASRSHFEACRLLIEKGAEVDVKNTDGKTPFYYASYGGHKELIHYLLDKGADQSDIEIRNAWGRTPLCAIARDGGDAETLKILITLGADVNAADKDGLTPIMLAAWRPYPDAVNTLLDAGADLGINTKNGELLLDLAARGLEKLFSRMIENGANLSGPYQNGGTLLHSAAGGSSLKIVETLVNKGFDPNKKDRFGWAPLHIAVEQGQKEIISFLLKKGADINARNILGETPYNIAQQRDDNELKSFLASFKADTAAPDFPKIKGKYLGRPRPGIKPEEFAPGIVSHRYRPHSTVAVSPAGDEIFWNPMIEPRGGGYSYGYIMTTRLRNGRWSYPVKAIFSEREFMDDHPLFSADGKRLYFVSNRPVNENINENQKRTWYVEKTKDGWGNPVLFDILPLPAETPEMFFTFSFDKRGNYYFISGKDIYSSQYRDGKYLMAEKLDGNINSGEVTGSPYISPDADYLIFFRGKPFVSFRKKDGSWSEAISLKEKIGNAINVTFSGKYIMIGGDRWVDAGIIEDLKPKELRKP